MDSIQSKPVSSKGLRFLVRTLYFPCHHSHSFKMSRPRQASSHSRGSSPFGDRSLSVTEATFQDLHLNETAGGQHLSIPPSYRVERPSYPRSELSASYLQSGFDPSNYSRNSSSESFINPLRASPAPTFGISDSDPLNFQIDPETANFHVQPNPSDPSVLNRTAMR